MAGRPTKSQNQARDMQAKIIETALTLFTRQGYFNTSVHHIQKAGNVSIGTIYHYFNNKAEIAKALYEKVLQQMTEMIVDILKHHESTHDRCQAVIRQLLDMTEADPEKMNYMLHANHQEFLPSEKPVCSSIPFELILNMVQTGIQRGEIRALSPVVASATIFGGALRLIHLRLDGALQEPVTEYFEEIWDSSWRGVEVTA